MFQASLSTTNPAPIDLRWDPSLSGERPLTNCHYQGVALILHRTNTVNNRTYITRIHMPRPRDQLRYKHVQVKYTSDKIQVKASAFVQKDNQTAN
jgi:hypothetical protein